MSVIITRDGLKYSAVQINGQKIVGPPLNVPFLGPPASDLEIYICNLPRDIGEEYLLHLFSSIGPVYEVRLLVCFSGFNRGYAYIRFYDQKDCINAIKRMDDYQVRPGQRICVRRSRNNRELLLGGIQQDMPDALIKELCQHISKDLQITIMRREQAKLAILTFGSHREAALARRQLLLHLKYFGEHPFAVWHRRNAGGGKHYH